jgi:hypothetical protein
MAPQTLKQIREKQRANAKAYREKMKNDPEFIAKERERVRKWREKNKKQTG